eukprot:2643984-Pleurochrysis_carterae.AAC.1
MCAPAKAPPMRPAIRRPVCSISRRRKVVNDATALGRSIRTQGPYLSMPLVAAANAKGCLLYTSDAADDTPV